MFTQYLLRSLPIKEGFPISPGLPPKIVPPPTLSAFLAMRAKAKLCQLSPLVLAMRAKAKLCPFALIGKLNFGSKEDNMRKLVTK